MRSDKKIKLLRLKSEEGIANNDDLLIEILIRLPVKSLLRFKSISKRWFSLITSPEVCRRLYPDSYLLSGIILRSGSQFRIHSDYLFISLRDNQENAPKLRSLSFVNDPYGIVILQSCNGLLLCSSHKVPTNALTNYYIYNPTTRQHVTLPQPGQDPVSMECQKRTRRIYGASLAFDPAKSPHYKVVSVRHSDDEWQDIERDIDDSYSLNQIEIYSSESRTWMVAGDPFVAPICTLFKNGIFCNGAIHWISWWGPSLYFNVEEEKVHEMPMPPVPDGWDNRRYVYFGESRHHLHLVEIYRGPTTQFDIHEMDKDYRGWSVKYRVDLDALTTAFPEMTMSYLDPSSLHYYRFDIVCVARQENEDDSYLVLHVPGNIMHYNLKAKTFRKICDVSEQSDNEGFCMDSLVSTYLWFGAFQCLESFCSV